MGDMKKSEAAYRQEEKNVYTAEQYRALCDACFSEHADRGTIASIRTGAVERITFRELKQGTERLEKAISEQGIRKNERIALLAHLSPSCVAAMLQLAYCGYTCVMVDANLPTAAILRVLAFSDVSAVLLGEDFLDLGNAEPLSGIPLWKLCDTPCEYELLHAPKKRRFPTIEGDHEVVGILFSSGTAGESKGVMLTYHSLAMTAMMFRTAYRVKGGMKYLLTLPVFHLAGWASVFGFFLSGIELGCMASMKQENITNVILAYEPNIVFFVPAFYDILKKKIYSSMTAFGRGTERLFKHMLRVSGFFRKHLGIKLGKALFAKIRKESFGKELTLLFCGGALCQESTVAFFLDLGYEWANHYSMTETAGPTVATGLSDRYPAGIAGSVHRFPQVQIRIDKPDAKGVGEILIRTELIMKGYFRRNDTEALFTDGYFRTGDIGFIDKKNNLHVLGRINEIYALKGNNKLAPMDIDLIYASYCKNELASCGRHDAKTGTDDVFLCVKREGSTQAELDKIKEKLLRVSQGLNFLYKIKDVIFVDDIPRTSLGKIRRFMLAELVEKAHTDAVSFEAASQNDRERFVLEKLKSIANQKGEIPMGADLRRDLAMDSLSLIELATEIENGLHIDISEALGAITDVRSLLAYIEKSETEREDADGSKENAYPFKRTRTGMAALRLLMKAVRLLYDFEIEGLENIDPKARYVICPNHVSNVDGIFVYSGIAGRLDPKEICCLAKRELFDSFFTRTLMQGCAAIPVERDGNTAAAYRAATWCMQKQGMSILIFPEGRRSKNGELGAMKDGAARLAKDVGAKLLPVCIEGTYRILPAGGKLPRVFDSKEHKKLPVKLTFCAPVDTGEKTVRELSEIIRESLASGACISSDAGKA